MQLSSIPTLVPLPFANSGTKNTIPTASQIGITAGAASLTDGFPPLTFTPIVAGGVPPAGADFNGILNLITQNTRWSNAGGFYPYSSTFSTAIGGYPKGALLARVDGGGFWLSLLDNNTNNPESVTTGWMPIGNAGATALTGLTNANVTLTTLQAAKDIITLAGTLTGNIQIIVPAYLKHWTVINGTTGNFTVTIKTSSGTGVLISQSGTPTPVLCDGTNVLLVQASSTASIIANGSINTSGDTNITIPANTAGRLTLKVVGLEANSAFSPYIRVNGYTSAAGYSWIGNGASNGGGLYPNNNSDVSICAWGSTALQDSSSTTSNPWSFDVQMPAPNSSDFKEIQINQIGAVRDSGGTNHHIYLTGGRFNQTAALTSIQIILRSANGNAGSGSSVSASSGTWYLVSEPSQ